MFLGTCVSVCMCKGSRKSQYLSEISAWNHERPDLSSVMEPDRVSSGFSPQTPHKPQSKSTKKTDRERQTEREKEQFGINRYSHNHATAFQHQRERKKGCGKNQGDRKKSGSDREWENMPTDFRNITHGPAGSVSTGEQHGRQECKQTMWNIREMCAGLCDSAEDVERGGPSGIQRHEGSGEDARGALRVNQMQ